MKRIAILGSTGSIGTQALDIIERNPQEFCVTALSCANRVEQLSRQITRFRPQLAVTAREEDARRLAKRHPGVEFYSGPEGLLTAAESDCDIVVNALMGIRGLPPTLRALARGRDIAFANKETLVAGGSLVMEAARISGAALLPVDSEHSAIFQCLQGNDHRKIARLILTGSGGPFRGYSLEQLQSVTLEQALAHPKWRMGSKITVDSATMMNKGFEIIEAAWLFGLPQEKIDVIIHPQSIIHSMVEFCDHAVMAQLGLPDMRVPISYALSYPRRLANDFPPLDFLTAAKSLTFEEPDQETFRCLKLARQAFAAGGSYPVILNGANEALVQFFLEKKIRFADIQAYLETILEKHEPCRHLTLEAILQADRQARRQAAELALGPEWRGN